MKNIKNPHVKASLCVLALIFLVLLFINFPIQFLIGIMVVCGLAILAGIYILAFMAFSDE